MAVSVDLSDQNILVAYHAILQNEDSLNWLVLRYNDEADALRLFASGSGGFAEMRDKIEQSDDIAFGFCREELEGNARYILITYAPERISSVRRARITVHSRQLAGLLEAQEASLAVSRIENLTQSLIRQALLSPSRLALTDPPGHIDRSQSQAQPRTHKPEKALPSNPPSSSTHSTPIRRAASEQQQPRTESPATPSKTGMFSNFLRRKKTLPDTPPPISTAPPPASAPARVEAPPPTPPKDKTSFTRARGASTAEAPVYAPPQHDNNRYRAQSLAEFGGRPSDGEDFVVIAPMTLPSQHASSHIRSKWGSESPAPLDPQEKARRRLEAQRRREEEEREAVREEEARQARIKREKAEVLRLEQEEERKRREILEEELRHAAAERRRKEREIKEAEEKRMRELQEKRRIDKERRLEEGRRMEQWRRDQQRVAEEAERRKEALRKQVEEDRKARIKEVEAKVKKTRWGSGPGVEMAGWASVQTDESLTWRRRYFKFSGSQCFFYRSPQDTAQALDTLELKRRVRGLKEWNEGYEYLESIPHSFAIEFTDGRGPWAMFCDSEQEKIELLGYLHQAAGL
ncbi:hypothetical protein PLICRDRAFT_44171 [Plicaturopsis crispa FD-325 SS-3]|nr:hypothetical protein PLICRDRAFT_44171 [Plicaturopsis crispa FD-325 SS-3]